MYLTREEERILEGEEGEILAKMMEILVKVGEIYHADRLIPITSAQISGVSYNTIGDSGLHFLNSLKGAKVRVLTTLNPLAFDERYLYELGVDEKTYNKQMEIIKAYVDIGVKTTATCTPYYFDNIPKFGEHIAWAESSAVIYVNSIIGARTNREGAITALASALIGKTPNYGLHLEKKRKATHLVELDFQPEGEEYPLLGLLLGERVKGIPYLRIGGNYDDFKLMGAAMAASGSVAMYHVENFTPEYRKALHDDVERIFIERKELENNASCEDVELVAIGCPHVSPSELRRIADYLKGKKKRTGVELWIFVARSVKERYPELIRMIENFGGKVMVDTCVVVSNAGKIYHTIGTNSGKAAFYLAKEKFGGAKVVVRDLYTLLRSVVQ
ncbi:MAG: aconitase X catalytic domain-containing protein [Thermoplasmata archaeon]|nr:aconitase X catalytic domain-containing protein [Thermoplasmata archaeon]